MTFDKAVKVFHYIIPHWGTSFQGVVPCGSTYCEWLNSEHIKSLRNNLLYSTEHVMFGKPLTTLSVYNIHSVWEKTRDSHPAICELPTNLTFAESEESWVRYSPLLDGGAKHFDGLSTTHPKKSTVQRIYKETYLDSEELAKYPLGNFSSLVKGSSYIASDCHRRDSANANRDGVVQELRDLGLRIDGLGRCMHTPHVPEGYGLPKTRDTRYNLHLKKQVIGKYMFHMAFENSIEDGYVTEKPFDALIAGTVPVYLGDPNTLKQLLPHPKAAICVQDYPDRASLVKYLNYLMQNETAYEEHRAWRKTFNYDDNIRHKALMNESWYCKICKWAAQTTQSEAYRKETYHTIQINDKLYAIHNKYRHCFNQQVGTVPDKQAPLSADMEGKTIRFAHDRTIYIVRKGILHAIPDLQTFISLKLDLNSVIVYDQELMGRFIIGDPEPRIA
eukprot:gene37806-45928_t